MQIFFLNLRYSCYCSCYCTWALMHLSAGSDVAIVKTCSPRTRMRFWCIASGNIGSSLHFNFINLEIPSSLWLCTFSLAVAIGAVLLLPISIASNEVLLLYPHSYYVKWLNSSLIQGEYYKRKHSASNLNINR